MFGNVADYKGRILVVDDDHDYSDGLVAIISTKNHQVEQAFNKKQAIDKLDDFDPEVILLDLRLGRASGVEILNEIRERNHPAICILITAYSSVDSAIDALRRGAYDYLQKPVQPETLLNIIDHCFDRIIMEREIRNHQVNLEEMVNKRTAELLASQNMYKSLTKMLPVGVIKIDENNLCTYANDKWIHLTGYASFEMMSKDKWYECFECSIRDEFLEKWKLFITSSEEEFKCEYKIECIEDKNKWILFEAKKIETGGVIATASDITKQKEILPELMMIRNSLGDDINGN